MNNRTSRGFVLATLAMTCWTGAAQAEAPGLQIEEIELDAAPRGRPQARTAAAPPIQMEKLVAGTYMAAVSADGKTIASGERQRLRVVTPGGGERVLRRAKNINYNGLDVSADGSLVHHRDGDGGVWLYDARTGREVIRVEATRSALTPAGELLWWEDNSAIARESFEARSTFAPRDDLRDPQARPGSCRLDRRRVDGSAQRLWLSECRDILMVAEDGSFAVIGQGGAGYRYATERGGGLAQDYFDALVRVDLKSGARTQLGGKGLARPQLSGDGRTVCGSPHDAFIGGQRELVRCQRDGGAPIELALPLDAGRTMSWTWLQLSHDGRWLAAGTDVVDPSGPRAGDRTLHVLPVARAARPVFSTPGLMLSWQWLPGSQRVALSAEHGNVAAAFLVDVAEGWSARIGEPGRGDQIVGFRPVGRRADQLVMVRTRGANKSGADVWRASVKSVLPRS